MTGAWLSLGLGAGALVGHDRSLWGFVLLAGMLLLVGFFLPRRVVVVTMTLLIGAATGILRVGWLGTGLDPTSNGSGIVQLVAERDDGHEFVVLRDDGRLIGLLSAEGGVPEGTRIAWSGQIERGRWEVGGVPVSTVYRVASGALVAQPRSALLPWIREWVRQGVLSTIPEPSGSLALGVLTGDDRGLTASTRARLRDAGLAHLTAVSGWNVSVVAAMTQGILVRLGCRRRAAWLASCPIVWGYAALTGLEPPVQRAAAMATVMMVAQWRGWPREPLSALGWTVVGLLMVRPELASSLSFQLSVIATAALTLVPRITGGARWSEMILTPMLVQLAVTPLLLARFGRYSLVGPLANILVEPVVPWLLYGALLGVFGGVVPGVGSLLGIPAWGIGQWVLWVAETLVRVPGAAGSLVALPITVVQALYLLGGTAVLVSVDRGKLPT